MSAKTSRMPTWLITGTSNGFGLALATKVLSRNHNLVSLSRHGAPHTKLVAASEAGTGRLHHLQHDLSNDKENTLKGLVQNFLSANPTVQIDILVNNAALAAYGPVETIPTATVQHLMTVNFYSPLWLIQAVLPSMRARNSAGDKLPKAIVNISSTQGLRCAPGELSYDASKHALEALSGVLATEVKVFGIRTMVVNLGSFRTSFATSGERAGFDSDGGQAENDPYAEESHPVRTRIDMVKKYASIPNAARGDVDKGAAILFDGVMGTARSEAEKALASQKDMGGVERLLIGSDGYVVIEQQVQGLLSQVVGCETVSKMADADDVNKSA